MVLLFFVVLEFVCLKLVYFFKGFELFTHEGEVVGIVVDVDVFGGLGGGVLGFFEAFVEFASEVLVEFLKELDVLF